MRERRPLGRPGTHRRRLQLEDRREADEAAAYAWRRDQKRYLTLAGVTIFLGVVLFLNALRLSSRSAGASADPVPTSLGDLEDGKPPPDRHVKIGPHVAVYGAGVPVMERRREGRARRVREELAYVVYPIVSREHPYLTRMRERREPEPAALPGLELPSLDLPPLRGSALPAPERFAVLVRTDRFVDEDSVPNGTVDATSVTGLLVDYPWDRGGAIDRAIRERYPDLDPGRVLVLEDGVGPTSTASGAGMMLGGIALAAGGLAGLMFLWRRQPPHRS
jgi:hypothetical protein